ncbi:MAG: hypothetical protein LBS50_12040 [Prevotellaceae bacterium]|nr:hypothetical protein [Prevotellaceae bacterium]
METFNQKIELYSVRRFSDMLGDTFSFVRQNFKPLFKGLFYIASPALLVAMIAGFFFWQSYMLIVTAVANAATPDVTNQLASAGGGIFGALPMTLAIFIASTLILGVTFSYIRLYREDKEREITVSMLWQETKKYFWKLIGAQVLLGVLVFILIIILAVFFAVTGVLINSNVVMTVLTGSLGGIAILCFCVWLAVKFSFLMLFIVTENKSVFGSFSDSYKFTKGIFWKTFGFIVVISLLVGFASYICIIPGYILMIGGTLSGSMNFGNSANLMMASSALISVGISISYLFYAVVFIGQSIFYHSIIEEREGISSNLEIEEIGKRD